MDVGKTQLGAIICSIFGSLIFLNMLLWTAPAQRSTLSDTEKEELDKAKKMYVMSERYGGAGMSMPVVEYAKKIFTRVGYEVSETDSVHCDVAVLIRYQTWDVSGKYSDKNTHDSEAGMEGEIIFDTGTWTHARKFSCYPDPAGFIVLRDGANLDSRESRFMRAFQRSFIAKTLELLVEIRGADSLTFFVEEEDPLLREAALEKLKEFNKRQPLRP